MENKLQQYALVAEIIGGIAILVTLIFLVLETRQSTNATQAQTYQSMMEELNNFRLVVIQPEFASLMVKYNSEGWNALEGEERFIALQITSARWGMYESAYFANKRGVLGDSEWTRFRTISCAFYRLDEEVWGANDVQNSVARFLTPEYVAFVEEDCANET